MGLKDRVRNLSGSQKPCPECGFPTRNVEVDIQVYTATDVDPVTGEASFDPPLPQPEVCPVCGRSRPEIHVKGMQEKRT